MEIRLAVTRPVIGSGTVLAAGFYSTTWPSSQGGADLTKGRLDRQVFEFLIFSWSRGVWNPGHEERFG